MALACNRDAVDLLLELRDEFEADKPFVISGNIGPRGDGYAPATMMAAAEAEDYHAAQVETLDRAGVDMVSAITMTHAGEATGIARACAKRGVPLALAFTVETDGRLPSGQPLAEAIRELDADPVSRPAYYMINCAHPDHFRGILEPGVAWTLRIRGLRANASRVSHAELDAAEERDAGNPVELGAEYASLTRALPNLRVFGGCCGTDHRHIEQIGVACLAAPRRRPGREADTGPGPGTSSGRADPPQMPGSAWRKPALCRHSQQKRRRATLRRSLMRSVDS